MATAKQPRCSEEFSQVKGLYHLPGFILISSLQDERGVICFLAGNAPLNNCPIQNWGSRERATNKKSAFLGRVRSSRINRAVQKADTQVSKVNKLCWNAVLVKINLEYNGNFDSKPLKGNHAALVFPN